jgi:IMP dehydrogenase
MADVSSSLISVGLAADEFFSEQRGVGLTFDDVSLATCYSDILPRQARLETALSPRLALPLPVLSSDMDTVTESEMAIAMALNGGLGLIHYNMSERQQVKQVARVKNHVHGLIADPITVSPGAEIGDVLELVAKKGYSFRTFPVVEESGRLAGLLPGAVVRARYAHLKVADAMTPRPEVLTMRKEELADDPVAAADRFFSQRVGIHKILVVDAEDRLCGLFTLSDVERIMEEAKQPTRPARDAQFRLACGAAVSAPRLAGGELDRERLLAHVAAMVHEGLDAVAVSTAHGHTVGVGETVRCLRAAFPELTIIAGNVTSAEGVDFLSDAGADAVKIGQGPGSICTTRVVAGVGIPQLTALYVASQANSRQKVALIADGGITKSGDMVKALTLADAVLCGGLLAGCREAPGKLIEINGKFYKEYRGMGSLEAMRAGSAARYGHEKTDAFRKVAPEGVEALKESTGSVTEVLSTLAGGLQSGMGYLGAKDLPTLRRHARYIRVSPAGQREAAPHDIIEIKTTLAGTNDQR